MKIGPVILFYYSKLLSNLFYKDILNRNTRSNEKMEVAEKMTELFEIRKQVE